jgi:hypothetical protein
MNHSYKYTITSFFTLKRVINISFVICDVFLIMKDISIAGLGLEVIDVFCPLYTSSCEVL